jgi:hypothetical protein
MNRRRFLATVVALPLVGGLVERKQKPRIFYATKSLVCEPTDGHGYFTVMERVLDGYRPVYVEKFRSPVVLLTNEGMRATINIQFS